MLSKHFVKGLRQLRTFSNTKRIFSNKRYLPSEEWLLEKNRYTEMGISQKAIEQF